MTGRSDGPSHWAYFNWPEIVREAKARLEQARATGKNAGEMDTLEYWCAWCAHANAANISNGPKPDWRNLDRIIDVLEKAGCCRDGRVNAPEDVVANAFRDWLHETNESSAALEIKGEWERLTAPPPLPRFYCTRTLLGYQPGQDLNRVTLHGPDGFEFTLLEMGESRNNSANQRCNDLAAKLCNVGSP